MARPPKPLHTLRFHQMRLSFIAGVLFFLAVSAHRDSSIFVPIMLGWVYAGIDLFAIIARKRGTIPAPELKYQPGDATEYDRIIKAIPVFLGLWCFSLVAAVTLFRNDSVPLALRIVAIMLSNLVSFTGFRWLQEVWKMIAAYKRQRRTTTGIHSSATASVAQAATQYAQQQSVSIAIRKGAQP